jgi:predicted glycogen debranching enzyme
MIQFTKETCGDLEAALRREWLETNGLGDFASSTIVGLNTRRHHGLLVTTTKPPVGRVVMLSKLEETFFIENEPFDLSANRYPGVVHPQGFRYLKQFRLDPFPVFTYEIEGIEIEKTVFLIHGENSTVVQYDLTEHNPSRWIQNSRLEVRPLIAFRDYHSTTHENVASNREIEQRPGLATIAPYPGCLLFMWRTALLSCERQLSGTGTSSTMPNENVVSIFRKISSIPAFCVST